eukprot:CAMPEP_0204526918 /NCGR_PEP_ID=MMETSP0661-20131031/8695_1 /ASSEMBLY_ACC=CAM_ASM_000606 /TAXON_ID=109239 /ORGANISM="Alexandrium margalefi, Strain AMGDE01CS-322" /LENGTH=180 /DNA_ID=CAMNT_0051532785 /DNA_START=115 /DNA_END=657 /DNA_ORIENTATION=-
MSFCRSARDRHHFTGSDDTRAPDYIKPPPALHTGRALRDAGRETLVARTLSVDRGPKKPLSRVPLKTQKMRVRPAFFAKEISLHGTANVSELLADASMGTEPHPLASYEKRSTMAYSGRQHVDDGALGKITSVPYDAEQAQLERRVALRGSQASQWANQGLGRSLLGADCGPADCIHPRL